MRKICALIGATIGGWLGWYVGLRVAIPTSAAAVGLLAMLGCSERPNAAPDYSALGNFDTVIVQIVRGNDTLPIHAELAETTEQQKLGLMERSSLPDTHGMIFVYDEVQDSSASFWMFRTRIPLDIAFADSAGTIVSIQQMLPCDSPNSQLCRIYPAKVRFAYALEVNQGFFARHGVKLGDRLKIAGHHSQVQ